MRKIEICLKCTERRIFRNKDGRTSCMGKYKHQKYSRKEEWNKIPDNAVWYDCVLDLTVMAEEESKYVLRGIPEGCRYAMEQMVVTQ